MNMCTVICEHPIWKLLVSKRAISWTCNSQISEALKILCTSFMMLPKGISSVVWDSHKFVNVLYDSGSTTSNYIIFHFSRLIGLCNIISWSLILSFTLGMFLSVACPGRNWLKLVMLVELANVHTMSIGYRHRYSSKKTCFCKNFSLSHINMPPWLQIYPSRLLLIKGNNRSTNKTICCISHQSNENLQLSIK